jgi:hypothetical protein
LPWTRQSQVIQAHSNRLGFALGRYPILWRAICRDSPSRSPITQIVCSHAAR